MKIYLIEKHEGSYDDYRISPVKAYEDESVAEGLIKIYNKDIKIVLEKNEKFFEKQSEDFQNFERKFNVWNNDNDDNYSKMIDSKEYIDWVKNNENEYNKILSLFKHEKFDYINDPIKYTVQEIELIKK